MTAILFDLDDTLLIDEANSREAMQETARLAAGRNGAEEGRFLADARRISQDLWADNPALDYCHAIGISAEECLWGEFAGADPSLVALRRWALAFRRELFDAALAAQGLPADDGALAARFAERRRRHQPLMPGAEEVLALLAPHFRLGLLTNGAPDLQREKIASSGLARFFQAITISGEHGTGKPSPEIFGILLRELGCGADQAMMVGNSLTRDIGGARSAGLAKAVWLQVEGSEEFADVVPDHTIQSLSELPGLTLWSAG